MHEWSRVFSLFVSLLGLGCARSDCPRAADEPADQSVAAPAAAHAESDRYALPGLDHGLIQSPVNILSSEVDAASHVVELNYDLRGVGTVANKGHTIELGFVEGMSIEFDGKTYALVQTHFHTPSEHLIDGVTYPMEMHVVSMAAPASPDASPEYLVIGLLFKMGAHSPFIDQVLAAVPRDDGERREVTPLYLADLLVDGGGGVAEVLESYYHYRGSLTTPPYSETVEWLVLKRVFEAAPAQIMAINAIEGDNARHIQLLLGRSVDG